MAKLMNTCTFTYIITLYWCIDLYLMYCMLKFLIVKKSSHIEISDSKFVVQSLVFKI